MVGRDGGRGRSANGTRSSTSSIRNGDSFCGGERFGACVRRFPLVALEGGRQRFHRRPFQLLRFPFVSASLRHLDHPGVPRGLLGREPRARVANKQSLHEIDRQRRHPSGSERPRARRLARDDRAERVCQRARVRAVAERQSSSEHDVERDAEAPRVDGEAVVGEAARCCLPLGGGERRRRCRGRGREVGRVVFVVGGRGSSSSNSGGRGRELASPAGAPTPPTPPMTLP